MQTKSMTEDMDRANKTQIVNKPIMSTKQVIKDIDRASKT